MPFIRLPLSVVLALSPCVAVFGIASPAHAGTITVTTTADEFGTGGVCSLREGNGAGPSRCDIGAYERVPPGGVPRLSVATYTVTESGPTAAITVTRPGVDSGTVGATLTLRGGTASAGADYTGTTFSVSMMVDVGLWVTTTVG